MLCAFFVRSLIFAYRRFTSCSLGKVRGEGGALSQSLSFLPPTLTPSLLWLFLQLLWANTLLLFFCVTREYPVGFTIQWLSNECPRLCLSQTHKQTHTPTLDLVVRLLLALLSTICGCFTLTDGCHGGVAWLAREEEEEEKKKRDRKHTRRRRRRRRRREIKEN